jgi:hypothetical protein
MKMPEDGEVVFTCDHTKTMPQRLVIHEVKDRGPDLMRLSTSAHFVALCEACSSSANPVEKITRAAPLKRG